MHMLPSHSIGPCPIRDGPLSANPLYDVRVSGGSFLSVAFMSVAFCPSPSCQSPSCSVDVSVRPYQGGCRLTLQAPVSSTGRLRGLFRVSRFRVILCRPRRLFTRWSPCICHVCISSVGGSSSPPTCGSLSKVVSILGLGRARGSLGAWSGRARPSLRRGFIFAAQCGERAGAGSGRTLGLS